MRAVLFLVGLVFLIIIEIARVYYIMPFPGSQVDEALDLAYFLHQNIWLLRAVGIIVLIYPAVQLVRDKRMMYKATAIVLLVFWMIVVYAFNFRFLADKMFLEPKQVTLVGADQNKVSPDKLVLGITINGKAKAYPIEIIGYHHQVRDTLAGTEVMITYCTVCRTGRVYEPVVNGKTELFRLVGMDHFNAMFEDASTGSWWRQVSGEAVAGSLKGQVLEEVPSQQMTLKMWLALYPGSLILQPDSAFKDRYAELEEYDEGTIEGMLEHTDSLSWNEKSWVVGVSLGLFSRAYDWNDLEKIRVVNDAIEGTPIALTLAADSLSFHVMSRIVQNDTLSFVFQDSIMIDSKYQTQWTLGGRCVSGKYEGEQLPPIQAYQEFWHSWRTFHPSTDRYQPFNAEQ